MKLVAGLGNPGQQYEGTRHNVGFEVVDRLVKQHVARGWELKSGSNSMSLEGRWRRRPADEDVIFMKPLTFMNLSGPAVGDVMRFYKIDRQDVLIVCDDVNLPLGRLRARSSGSEGGHNGLRSIAESLGTIDYARLRVGVGRGDERRDLADHVLSRFDPDEVPGIEDAVARAADAVGVWITDGLTRMMNTFNRADDN